jgi:large subunit ribosomal protein L4
MPEIAIKDINNKEAGRMSLPDEVFGLVDKVPLMHAAVKNFLANQRQGTHSAKERGEVSGGGRKPYKQKGTGRARQGSMRAPQMRGGAIIFGPRPRDYSYAMPKRERREALKAALSAKVHDGEFHVVTGLAVEAPRTKTMLGILAGLGFAETRSVLVVVEAYDKNVLLSARNIPGVSVRVAAELSVYDVLVHEQVLATRAAVEAIGASRQGGARS